MSLRHRLSDQGGGRKSQAVMQQQQQQQKRQEKPLQRHHSPDVGGGANYGDSFHYQPSVLDNLSVTLGHTVGHFDAVKGNLRNIYHSLVIALCRHDPLPGMVRAAIVRALLPAAPKVPPPPHVHHHVAVHKPLFEQQHRSDIETITALDIPYSLRYFDFSLSVVNNSEVSAAAHTMSALATTTAVGTWSGAAAAGGSFSFSLSEMRTRPGRIGGGGFDAGHGGGGGGIRGGAMARTCQLIAGLLVDTRLSGTVRWASKEAAMRRCRFGGVSSMDRCVDSSGTLTGAPQRSTFDTSPVPTSTEFTSSPSNSNNNDSYASPPPPPSLLTTSASCPAGERSGGLGGTVTTLSLTGQMIPTGLDGSNSNRATFSQQQQSRTTTAETGQRLCALHSDRSRIPTSESSCAVCASQHFLHRHLQRLAQEPGGLIRLEDLLCDCLKLQEQWRRSVHWVAGSVKDKRLPDSLRPLMRCIGADAICDSGRGGNGVGGGSGVGSVGGCGVGGGCSGSGVGGGVGGGVGCPQGVTLDPQIIISTDGHCSALQCVNRCGSGSGGGMTGGGASARWQSNSGGIGGGGLSSGGGFSGGGLSGGGLSGGGLSGGGLSGVGGSAFWNAPPSATKESMPP